MTTTQTTASRNKREGRYIGRWFRRHRRSWCGAVGERVNPGAVTMEDFAPTRKERRAMKLRGYEYDDELEEV